MRRVPVLTVLMTCFTLAACDSGGAGSGEPELAAMGDHAMMPELPATDGPGYTVADVRFMQNMIGHHAQAVDMSAMAPTHGAGSRLLQLAQKIGISQADEIRFMREWLAERDQAVTTDEQAHAMMMPGMLTPEQMAELDAANGTEFDRLFLTYMIMHHDGALVMVEDLFDAPMAAQDPDIFRFVTDIDIDQRAEIDVMTNMLAVLDTTRGSSPR